MPSNRIFIFIFHCFILFMFLMMADDICVLHVVIFNSYAIFLFDDERLL